MGAGILPTTLHNGELYFLFGKENKYEDSAPGFSDFGGGQDNSESFLVTAIRESQEELTGFLGDTRGLLKRNFPIDLNNGEKFGVYRMFIVHYPYNEWLPYYYNNNQKFLQKRLDKQVYKNSKIFEKAEIRWIPLSKLKSMKSQFRSYFQRMIPILIKRAPEIRAFLSKRSRKTNRISRSHIAKKTLKRLKNKP